jgi:two-component system sensor histidine kinase/response regulator
MIKTRKKIINQIQLLGGVLILVLGCIDLLMGGWEIGFLKIVFCIPFLFGYFQYRKKKVPLFFIQFLLFLSLCMIVINFFFNGGHEGPTNYAFFLMTAVYCLLLPRYLRYFWFLMMTVVFGVIQYIDVYEVIEVVNVYTDPFFLFVDLFVTYMFCGFFILLSINIFLDDFQNQSKLLSEAKSLLTEKLKEQTKINSQKNNLIGVLAHDLKNPIKALGQTIELYEKRALETHELDMLLRNLKTQFNSLDFTLESTLDYVKADLQNFAVKKSEINAIEFSKEIIERFTPKAISKSIKMKFDHDESILCKNVTIPVNAIDIILRNLLDNALKFTPSGGSIWIRIIVLNGNKLKWSIKDNGEGISEKSQQSILAEEINSTPGSLNERGSGLGLKFCLNLVKKIDSQLYFETEKGKGTVFYLEVPYGNKA